MGLYEKLVGSDPQDVSIPVHQFMAAVAERDRGVLDRQDLIDTFNIETADLEELDTILDKADSLAADRQFEFGRMLHDILLLSEAGLTYTTSTDFYTRIDDFA